MKPFIHFGEIKSIMNVSCLQPMKIKYDFFDSGIWKKLFFLNHRSKREIQEADCIIFESNPALFFFDACKKLNSSAKFIYRMSDDVSMLNLPKSIADYEKKIISSFDLVSVPSQAMFEKFFKLSPNNVQLHHHGVDKNTFDKELLNPYAPGTIHHVFVGNSYFDSEFVEIASEIYSGHLFHVIGNIKETVHKKNIIYYGAMSFTETVKYIKFASIGLHIISRASKSAVTLSESLKVLQYSYCKLPIILPDVIPMTRNNFFWYSYGNRDSIRKAIENALNFNKDNFSNGDIYSWKELSAILLGHDETG